MAHISGHDRSQTLLFPEAIDDYVGPDNPVRFIDAFVDGLDLAAAGFVGVEPKATGRATRTLTCSSSTASIEHSWSAQTPPSLVSWAN